MKWNKFKKIIICIMVVLVVSIVCSNVYADINTDYYNNNLGAFKVKENKSDIEDKTIASVLLDALGSLVYALASLGEWLLGFIFQAASGGGDENNIFPWADAILFNAIPFLDINFLNPYVPAGGTMETGGTVVGMIRGVIETIYGTIFGLAISFFSIAVLIMGIKLAVSTVASEKAKYKQAIWDWLVGIVLLFTMHFFISFVFYLNEELVIVAEDIASTNLSSDKAKKTLTISNNSSSAKENVTAFIASQTKVTGVLDFFSVNGIDTVLQNLKNAVDGDTKKYINILTSEENVYIADQLLRNQKYTKYSLLGDWAWSGENSFLEILKDGFITNARPERVYVLADSVTLIKTWKSDDYDVSAKSQEQIEYLNKCRTDDSLILNLAIIEDYGGLMNYDAIPPSYIGGDFYSKEREEQIEFLISIVEAHKEVYYKVYGSGDSVSLIANLAEYFKEAAWSYGGSWKRNKVVIQNAIMYAILVVQSFIFLISYTKRLFYVIILAIMAPLVVVYDFFNRSIS